MNKMRKPSNIFWLVIGVAAIFSFSTFIAHHKITDYHEKSHTVTSPVHDVRGQLKHYQSRYKKYHQRKQASMLNKQQGKNEQPRLKNDGNSHVDNKKYKIDLNSNVKKTLTNPRKDRDDDVDDRKTGEKMDKKIASSKRDDADDDNENKDAGGDDGDDDDNEIEVAVNDDKDNKKKDTGNVDDDDDDDDGGVTVGNVIYDDDKLAKVDALAPDGDNDDDDDEADKLAKVDALAAAAADDDDDDDDAKVDAKADNGDAKVDADADGDDSYHILSSLSCDKYGGPSDKVAEEMVYWSDIPGDSEFVSPYKDDGEENYLTFELDGGGWNNVRMAMETIITMSIAMGRTLVMPPQQKLYLLDQEKSEHNNKFSIANFFHMNAIVMEHRGFRVITTEEFLKRMAMTGQLVNQTTGKVAFPPQNKTNWDGLVWYEMRDLWFYLRAVLERPNWDPNDCVLAFPSLSSSSNDNRNAIRLKRLLKEIEKSGFPNMHDFIGKPTPVDASPTDRLREMLGGRKKLCLYDESMRRSRVLHFASNDKVELRLLTHFYSFLFFEDWKQDLWTKRFVRDHLRYVDEIQCAAGRVVEAVRAKAREKDPEGNPEGAFDSAHVRRGDFQYKETRLDGLELYKLSKDHLTKGGTLYIATDERNMTFFAPFREHYNVFTLGDFMDLIPGLNANYYGMLDQLIASRGATFYGTWFSTFTGYINRMRGYDSVKRKLRGYENGVIRSWSFNPEDHVEEYRSYYSVRDPFYMREFPVGWRDIDKDVEERQSQPVKTII